MKKRNVAKEELSISVSGLKNIKVLFKGDLYELALILQRGIQYLACQAFMLALLMSIEMRSLRL
jgi:hypothetical protein